MTSEKPVSVSPRNNGVYRVTFKNLPRPLLWLWFSIHIALLVVLAYSVAAALDRMMVDTAATTPLPSALLAGQIPVLLASIVVTVLLLPWGSRYGRATLTIPLVSASLGVFIGAMAHIAQVFVGDSSGHGLDVFGAYGDALTDESYPTHAVEPVMLWLAGGCLVLSIVATITLARRSNNRNATDAARTLVEVAGEITDVDTLPGTPQGGFRRSVLVSYVVSFVDRSGARHWVKHSGVFAVGQLPRAGDPVLVRFDPLAPSDRRAIAIEPTTK